MRLITPLLFCRPILSEGDSEDDVLSGEDREDIVVSNEPQVRLSDTRGKSLGDMPNDDTHDVTQGKNEFDTRISAFLGPFVQSIVSLTKSLRRQLVKYMLTIVSNPLLFFVEKM